jgi:ATP-dependent RNA helicase DeaD
MPPEIMRLAETNMNMPKRILVDSDDLSGAGIQQSFLVLRDKEKSKFLLDFIHGNIGQCIVFCSTKIRTRNVAKMLSQSGERCVTVEGDMSQHKREDSMTRFRKSKTDILVATDVAARGIDIPQVALVINYDVPNQDMIYFHRIGRTARAGAKGRAITLVSYSSVGEWNQIKKQTSVKMTDLNEQLGIKVKIPDPLKRQGGMRQHFRQNNSTSKPFYKKRVIARDQYARKKKNAGYVKRSNFSQKKRW